MGNFVAGPVERSNHPVAVSLTHRPPSGQEAPQNAVYEVLSDLLTRDSAYSPADVAETQNLPDAAEIIARATAMHETLANVTTTYENKLATDPSQKKLIEAINRNDETELGQRGLDFSYTQFDEVLAAFLAGRPPVDIETVGPYLCAHLNQETGALEIKMENLPVEEAVGIQMAAIFKKLTHAVEGKVRIVALLDEFNNYVDKRGFNEEEQDAYIVAIAELFGRAGVIEPDDEAGKDFLLLRESEQIHKVDNLIERLKASEHGKVSNNEQGELIFTPDQEFVDSLKISSNRRKEFKKKGILLRDAKGKPQCQALDAAGFLSDENKHLMHVVMLEEHMTSQQDKVFTLLKALGITNERRYHNVFFDTEHLPPEVIVYGVAKKLQMHMDRLMNILNSADHTPDNIGVES